MLLPDTHRAALHTGSSAARFCRGADANPKRGLWMVHDKKQVWKDLVFSAWQIKKGIGSSPFIFLSSAVHMLEPARLRCYLSPVFACSYRGEIKPGKMQKCCRTAGASKNPAGLIEEYNRAHCTVQLRNRFFVKWGLQFYCHYSVAVSAFISSPYSKAFFRTILTTVGKETCEFGNHPVLCEELGCWTAQLGRDR